MKILPGKYLVAGATGLMGRTALEKLFNIDNIQIRAIYHYRKPKFFAKNIKYIKADLTNREQCIEILKDIDYVLMFAGILSTSPMLKKDPVCHIMDNLLINANMLYAAYVNRVKKYIYLSSPTGYPEINGVLLEDTMFVGDPPDNYFCVGWMTRYVEKLCELYANKLDNGFPIIILRPATIYGEYESFDLENSHLLPALVRKVVERHEPIEIWGNGQNERDFIYKNDVFDACLIGLEKVNDFCVCNIGTDKYYSVNKLLNIILKLDGYENAKIIYNKDKPNSVKKTIMNFEVSKKCLGFEAKTSLEEGVRKVIEYYRWRN